MQGLFPQKFDCWLTLRINNVIMQGFILFGVELGVAFYMCHILYSWQELPKEHKE